MKFRYLIKKRKANDSVENLMFVHGECHHAIHFGAEISVVAGSLADLGDSGKGDNAIWKAYLKEHP